MLHLFRPAALALPLLLPFAAAAATDPATLSATVRELASDEYEGRAPGTAGEARTVDYLISRLKALGLQPAGDHGGWTQAVPLLRTRVAAAPRLSLEVGGARIELPQGQLAQVSTLRPAAMVEITRSPLVFVGYGVSAAERDWDDFKGVDLHGKTAVFLVNDPDFEATPIEPVYGRFGGQAMTYYGRWTYKFEEAARRGASAALIIHDTAGAGYGWSTVAASQGEAYDIVRGAADAVPLPVQGWLQQEVATELFRRAGLDLAALRRAARRADFHPVAIGDASFSAALTVTAERVESRNVLARITGAKRPQESVMYGAHWDAYGVGAPDAKGDPIRHGANDDALGVAALLEIARQFAAGPPPERTVLFGFWTAEERNLLGSETYALHPLLPLSKTVANFTVDIMQTAGPSRDVVLVGAGQNRLEADLAEAARGQGRVVTADSHPEKGLFYRADHFSFAKRGVPTLLLMGAGGGADLVQGGRAAGQAWVDGYTANCYHKACDAWSPDWDLRGAAQDIDLIFALGRDLAFSARWPEWNDGSEFKAIRALSAADRRAR